MKGRTLGIILLAGGLIVGVVVTAVLWVLYNENNMTASGFALGITLAILVFVLPQWGIGAYMLWHGSQEVATQATANKQRQLLNIVKTQGQLPISDLVIELDSSSNEVKQLLYQLVGMGLFTGYVNWEKGMLYSQQATELRTLSQCANCTGQLELAGHGIIRCPYCDTEYFLN